MTNKERMLSGELYKCDGNLVAEGDRARRLCRELYGEISEERRQEIARELFGKCGKSPHLTQGFYCDYGSNIEVGDNFYCNYGVCILDVCKVRIGDNCLIAPQVGIYAAAHPLDRKLRTEGWEYGKEVVIGDDCWIGGGAIINPGVTLGDNVVVGSGAVVTRSFPSNVVIAGNPAKIIRRL